MFECFSSACGAAEAETAAVRGAAEAERAAVRGAAEAETAAVRGAAEAETAADRGAARPNTLSFWSFLLFVPLLLQPMMQNWFCGCLIQL